MALSNAQRVEIQKRALSGESGSSLAKEFGVSPSVISRIKNHLDAETAGATPKVTKTAKVKKAKVKKAKVKPSEKMVKHTKGTPKKVSKQEAVLKSQAESVVVPTSNRTAIVSSPKFSKREFINVKANTLGEFLEEIWQDANVSGVVKVLKQRSNLKMMNDILPWSTTGEPLHIMLVASKPNTGNVILEIENRRRRVSIIRECRGVLSTFNYSNNLTTR